MLIRQTRWLALAALLFMAVATSAQEDEEEATVENEQEEEVRDYASANWLNLTLLFPQCDKQLALLN